MTTSTQPETNHGFFSSLTIKTKLRTAFLIIIGVFIGIILLVDSRMNVINQKSTEIAESWMPSIVYTGGIDAAISKLRINVAYHVLIKDPDELAQLNKQKETLLNEIAELRQKYAPLISSEEEKGIYQQFSQAYEEYLKGAELAMSLGKKGDTERAIAQIHQNGLLFSAVGTNLQKLVELNHEGGIQASNEGDVIFAKSRQTIVGASVAVIIFVILLVWMFERMISRPLEQLTGIIQRLAAGDTTVTHSFQNRHDEVGQIATAVGNIIAILQALTKDAMELIQSAQGGMLSVRADSSRHPGEFGNIVGGMNQLLEELSKPLTEIAQVMQQLALGNLKGRMQGAYEGDLRALKANVNRSLDALVSLLDELAEVTRRMAKGDLTHTLTGNYQGDFADLKTNVNQAVMQLKEVLQGVVTNTEHISTATTQTSEAASHVAEQSSQQMSSLEEVAVAIEETASSVNEISANATQGNDLARTTADLAEQGRLQLGKLIEIIEQIAAEYNRIEQTTGKITRIADKTHLLSLNAGLEAVRAGEHGLGFGFVAQQIGKLAEEAAISARDIGTVITSSSQSVHLSVNAAQETRAAIERIAQAARNSGNTVQAISAAITQQSAAVQSLSQQVSKLQSGGEANASAAEEISRTMGQLAQTVQQTFTQVQRFTLA